MILNTVATIGFVMLLPCGSHAGVQILPGFEVVEISSGDVFHNKPRMNDCGEVVFNTESPSSDLAEIWYYDNGRLIPLTDDNISDSFPDINDSGTITWTKNFDGNGHGEAWILENGVEQKLGDGVGSTINRWGVCAWRLTDEQSCAYETAVFEYDSGLVTQISDYSLSNQGPRINDLGQIAWTRYDFSACTFPNWTSQIMLYTNGNIVVLPTAQETPQGVDINSVGAVAWGNFDYIEIYSDGVTETFAEGSLPALNDIGDVAFSRLDPYWNTWVYFEGEYYRLTEGTTIHQLSPDINNDGEVVWNWIPNGDLHPSGVMLMRRIRNGDVNFDREVDLVDHASFATCATGPGDFARLCRCRFADMQHDRDVDLADIALFQNTFHHLQLPGHECCDSSHGPGCNDASVQNCVCAVAPDCCDTNWSESCIVLVELLGCGTCP